MNNFAKINKKQERYEEAESLLLEAIEGRRLKLGDTHPRTIDSIKNLIDLYEAWNKPEEAEKWRAKLLKTEVKKRVTLHPQKGPIFTRKIGRVGVTNYTKLKWTNPSTEARNMHATNGFISPTVRLRFAFGQHHKSNKVNH